MKLAVLYGKTSDQHHYFLDAFQDHFDKVLGVPMTGTRFCYDEEGARLLYKSTDLCQFDAVFLRLFGTDLYVGEHVPEILIENGVYTQMEKDSLSIASNKFYSMRVLAEGGVQVPKSIYTLSTKETVKAAEKIGYPVIVKLISGYGGKGVMKATSKEELRPIIDTLEVFEQEICLQEFIQNPGEDVRVVVVGDETFSYKRVGSEEEWRSNVSRGGDRVSYDAPEEVRETAIKAARLAGFDICGVDIIESEQGPMVAEINFSPGLTPETCEIIGADVHEKMASLIKEKVLDKKSKLDDS